jgi:hypothetical protein
MTYFPEEIDQMMGGRYVGCSVRPKRTHGRGALSSCPRGHLNGPKRTAQDTRLGSRVGDAVNCTYPLLKDNGHMKQNASRVVEDDPFSRRSITSNP